MTTTTKTTRVAPAMRRVRRFLTPPVVAVLAVTAGLTLLFAAAWLGAGGPLGGLLLAVAGAGGVAGLVVLAMLVGQERS